MDVCRACASLLLLSVLGGTPSPGVGLKFKVVDLTHEQSPSTIYWPGNPEYNFTILQRRQFPNYWYESNFFETAEHGGTHMDAPAHFFQGKQRTAQIPMEKLAGPGVIIDVEDKARNNPDYQVTVNDLRQWEGQHGSIPDGAVVIMKSGWYKKYPNKTEVFQTSTPDTPSTFHFPGWHENATRWLTSFRKVHVVGVDTPSTDYGQSTRFPTHVILGEHDIPGVENVANLDKIPDHGSVIFVAVIKLQDGSGGPARVFATIGDFGISSSRKLSTSSSLLMLLFAFVVILIL